MDENYYLSYEVKLLSDVLVVDNQSDGNMVRTYDYIPGTTILGVFASQYIHSKVNENLKKNAHLDEGFYRYFLKGELIFSNAYFMKEDEYGDKVQFYPTPLSIHVEKKDSQKLHNLAYDDDISTQTKAIGGFSEIIGTRIRKDAVHKKLNFHHQRDDRLKGSSKEGTIFFYESLEKGQVFYGTISGKKEILQKIKQTFGNTHEIRIGRSKQTQYGRAMLTLGKIKAYPPLNIDENEEYVALILRSPAILFNDNGYPEVSVPLLYQYLKEYFDNTNFEIVNQFAKVEYIDNYLSVWQMKKPKDVAFSAGSVYILSFPDGLNQTVINKLQSIEINGFGERRHEGFGNVKISAIEEFYQLDSVELNQNYLDMPDSKPTKSFTVISLHILKEFILKGIEAQAYTNAGMFNNRLNNSLLGRLENMLNDSDTFDDFLKKLEQLKEPAKNQLDKCNYKQRTLYELLKSGFDVLENKFTQLNKINSFLNKTKIDDPHKDKNFLNDCLKLYWTSFFRRMRKLNQVEVKS